MSILFTTKPIVLNVALAEAIGSDHVRVTEKGWKLSLKFKRLLWDANDGQCCYCGSAIQDHKTMHVDHWVPLCAGGDHSIDNLVCACPGCNMKKGGRDIEYLRLALSLSGSPIAGLINPAQASALLEAGCVLPLKPVEFHFEKGVAL